MLKYLQYFKEDGGKEVVDVNGKGFFTYCIDRKLGCESVAIKDKAVILLKNMEE